MTQINGQRSTLDSTAKMIVDMSNKIALLQPTETPFVTFLKRAKNNTEVANNPEFNWLEDDLRQNVDAINSGAGYVNTATSIIVDNGDCFSVNDIVKVPRTGEVMLVTAVATNTLTVIRGYGVTAAAALVDNDPLFIIGSVAEEGSGTRTVKSTVEGKVSNFTQIWKTPFALTRTMDKSATYGGNDFAYQQKKHGIEHMRSIAQSLIFGEKKLDTTGTKPKRATGGLLSFLTQNNYDAGGLLTKAEFDTNIAQVVFKYGAKEKLMFASTTVLSVFNSFAESALQTKQGEDTFGLAISKYITPHGVLHLVPEPLFDGAVYGGYGAIIDPENVKWRPLNGSDTKLKTNIQANDVDGRTDEYMTEGGLEVRLPKTHALLTGVTG